MQRGEQLYPNETDNFMWRGWAFGFAGRLRRSGGRVRDRRRRGARRPRVVGARLVDAYGDRARQQAAALEQLRISENITAAEPQPLFLPMWAYCLRPAGTRGGRTRIVAAIEQREAAGTRFGAGGWAMASLAVGDEDRALEWLETAADKAANHELDEGFFNLMALRANVTNDETLRQPQFVDSARQNQRRMNTSGKRANMTRRWTTLAIATVLTTGVATAQRAVRAGDGRDARRRPIPPTGSCGAGRRQLGLQPARRHRPPQRRAAHARVVRRSRRRPRRRKASRSFTTACCTSRARWT